MQNLNMSLLHHQFAKLQHENPLVHQRSMKSVVLFRFPATR